MDRKRLSLFCGHFGSGKTNIAVNYAEMLRSEGLDVVIADLDIVNPYFRTKDSEDELKAKGIDVLTLPYANTNVDLPVVPKEAYGLFTDKSRHSVLDIGGDDRGAYVLGMFRPYILGENDFDMFYVVNFYRYLTRTPELALEVMREIEQACGIKFTSVINNSNLGKETTREDITFTAPLAGELCELAGLPMAFTAAAENIAGDGDFALHLQKSY